MLVDEAQVRSRKLHPKWVEWRPAAYRWKNPGHSHRPWQSEVRGRWSGCFEIIRSQQELNEPLVRTEDFKLTPGLMILDFWSNLWVIGWKCGVNNNCRSALHDINSSDCCYWWNGVKPVSWTCQWVPCTQMASTITRSQSNGAPLGCGGWEIHTMDVQPTNQQQLCDAVVSIWTEISEDCCQQLVESMPPKLKQLWRPNPVLAWLT